MVEAPLLLRLQDFERRHDEILTYIFDVVSSCQKQFFFDMTTAFANYMPSVPVERAPTVPLIFNHGIRTDMDEVRAAILKQNQAEKELGREKPQTAPATTTGTSKPIPVDVEPSGYAPQPVAQPVEQPPMYDMSAYAQPVPQPAPQPVEQPPMYDMSAYAQPAPQHPVYDMSAYAQPPMYDMSAYAPVAQPVPQPVEQLPMYDMSAAQPIPEMTPAETMEQA